jgi:hypothetical protein
MAKEIIRKGVEKYEGRCSECGCVFTYDRSDVLHNYVNGGEWVGCPSCGHGVRHFGASGTAWPKNDRWGRGACSWDFTSDPTRDRGRERMSDRLAPRGGYVPIGPLPRGSCFGN